MPTTFPGANDVFQVPVSPTSTPLGTAGPDGRTHSHFHGDVGDAIEAMQDEATYLAHTHDGSFRQGAKLDQANTHESPDTDAGTSSIHHTVDATQVSSVKFAAGNHTHPVVASYPVGGFFISVLATSPSALGITGTWTSVGQRFLVAQGGAMALAAGVNGGSNTHTHTVPTSSSSNSHSHTNSNVSSGDGYHAHNPGGTTSSNGFSHYHSSTQVGQSSPTGSSNVTVAGTHVHNSGYASASHSHSVPATSADGSHGHTVPDTGTEPAHTHTVSNLSSASNLVPYLVVYMWKRVS